jgi:hypothetical protein
MSLHGIKRGTLFWRKSQEGHVPGRHSAAAEVSGGVFGQGKSLNCRRKTDDNVRRLGLGQPGLTCQGKCGRMKLGRKNVSLLQSEVALFVEGER